MFILIYYYFIINYMHSYLNLASGLPSESQKQFCFYDLGVVFFCFRDPGDFLSPEFHLSKPQVILHNFHLSDPISVSTNIHVIVSYISEPTEDLFHHDLHCLSFGFAIKMSSSFHPFYIPLLRPIPVLSFNYAK